MIRSKLYVSSICFTGKFSNRPNPHVDIPESFASQQETPSSSSLPRVKSEASTALHKHQSHSHPWHDVHIFSHHCFLRHIIVESQSTIASGVWPLKATIYRVDTGITKEDKEEAAKKCCPHNVSWLLGTVQCVTGCECRGLYDE